VQGDVEAFAFLHRRRPHAAAEAAPRAVSDDEPNLGEGAARLSAL
jgi:hypothetical protein